MMHCQLEWNSLDNGFLFIRHFPLQWISLHGGSEQARQGDYSRISLYKGLPFEWISLHSGFPFIKGCPCIVDSLLHNMFIYKGYYLHN